jgi:protein TonB
MAKKQKNLLWLFLLTSLFLHFSIYFGLNFVKTTKHQDIDKEKTIEIVFVDNKNFEEKKQLVEQNQKTNEVDENAKFMSKHNNKVKEQTKAKKQGDFKNATQAQKTLPSPQQSKSVQHSLKSFIPKLDPFSQTYAQRLEKQLQQDSKEKQAIKEEGIESATNDYLKDIKSADKTLLNTKEFVFYSYYQRIRKQIRQQWEPNIKGKIERLFLQGRQIASVKDHMTQVVIILDQFGNLTGVQLLNESGLKDLDKSAIEAFKAAEPFPNPPKGIIDADGKIRIRWDFILEA